MNHLLITTKFSIPTLPARSVNRIRLQKKLDEAFFEGQRVTLVTAPAGFGKSTLLSYWVREQTHASIAWLSLDENDNYPELFLQYLHASITHALPQANISSFPTSWNDLSEHSIRHVLTPFVNQITSQSTPLIIVLDDFHEITNPLLHTATAFLIKYLPLHIHLIISSRTEPPLLLSSLRAYQQLSEIQMDDLRFRPDEVRTFFQDQRSIMLLQHELNAIDTYTEGWPVGIHLVALAMNNRTFKGTQFFPHEADGNNQFILEYLADEVFHELPETAQQFLIRTSILERLNNNLCQALVKDSAGSQTLGDMVQRNLFLVQLGEQKWYRYHQLFSQFLRMRLKEMLASREIVALHVRASNWLSHHGLLYEAINHLVEAEAWSEMLELLTPTPSLEEISPSAHIWRRWLRTIPDHIIITRPDLYLIKIWSELLGGDISVTELGLKRDDVIFPKESQGIIHLLRQHVYSFRGEHEQSIYEGHRALELLSPETEPLLWAMGATMLGNANILYTPYATSSLVERAWEIASSLGEPMVMLLSAGKLAEIALFSGKLHLAKGWLQEVQHLVTHGYTVGVPFWCRVATQVAL